MEKQRIAHLLTHPKDIALGFMKRTAPLWCDAAYLKIVYRLTMGKPLDLKNPKSFTEKLNWLKIHHRRPEYTRFVDKYEVKEAVNEILGTTEHTIPTIKVWNSPEEIDLAELPEKFVLKTTNGGGNTAVVICRDKSKFNLVDARKRLKFRSGNSIYYTTREYPYRNITPRIIAEEYVEAPGGELSDYKIFCFDGKPKFLFVGTDRQTPGEEVKFDFFDTDFKHLALRNGHQNAKKPVRKPENFDEMLAIAAKLSQGMPHVRVDLYSVGGKIYFGEMTFFHFGAIVPFDPDEWDTTFGQYLSLPKEN